MEESPEGRQAPQGRRVARVLVVVLAWALVATGIVGWMVVQPKGPTQSAIWASNAATLRLLTRNFFYVASDTARYLSTLDGNWTWDALNWTYTSRDVVADAILAGGFASGAPLGLNVTAMCVAAYGYEYLVTIDAVAGYRWPSIFEAAGAQMGVYQNLSARLANVLRVGVGEDPLVAIGADNVTTIHTLTATLWNMNLVANTGYGPIVSELCGV